MCIHPRRGETAGVGVVHGRIAGQPRTPASAASQSHDLLRFTPRLCLSAKLLHLIHFADTTSDILYYVNHCVFWHAMVVGVFSCRVSGTDYHLEGW